MRLIPALPVLFAALLIGVTMLLRSPAPAAQAACAFPVTPTTYEGLKNRQMFLDTIELAAFNMLFPGDPYFGLPNLEVGNRNSRSVQPGYIPPVLLKSIGWIESSITQGGAGTPYGSIGPALVSFDCGHGIAQVTSGMTLPQGEAGRASPEQALVATHFAYNIARGAAILADKWNQAPENAPIAGTDTDANPGIIENWYFAVWAYNGFTGPGANRSNHPMDPIYGSWPRTAYSCGPANDGKGHDRSKYPYQELVFGCTANPPTVDNKKLWSAQAVTLPDLKKADYKNTLALDNFVYPYSEMDIKTPKPSHVDSTNQPSASKRNSILGNPILQTNKTTVALDQGGTASLDLVNPGTGVLAWYAITSASWIKVTPYAGASAGGNLPCDTGSSCDRAGHVQISIDPSKTPGSRGTITFYALGTDQQVVVTVTTDSVIRLGAPGVAHN